MDIEEFVNEGIRRSNEKGYFPTKFMQMRSELGTVEAIRRLVETSEPQSGFKKMRALGLSDWTMEAAVIRYPDQQGFSEKTFTYAQARLDGVLDA